MEKITREVKFVMSFETPLQTSDEAISKTHNCFKEILLNEDVPSIAIKETIHTHFEVELSHICTLRKNYQFYKRVDGCLSCPNFVKTT
jgi:hypothetical protein